MNIKSILKITFFSCVILSGNSLAQTVMHSKQIETNERDFAQCNAIISVLGQSRTNLNYQRMKHDLTIEFSKNINSLSENLLHKYAAEYSKNFENEFYSTGKLENKFFFDGLHSCSSLNIQIN